LTLLPIPHDKILQYVKNHPTQQLLQNNFFVTIVVESGSYIAMLASMKKTTQESRTT
jgi:hypothetical protein